MAEEITGVPYGAYHLSANPGQYQPQLAQNFLFIFPDFPRLLKEGKTGEEDDAYVYDVSDKLQVSLISTDVPSYNQGEIVVRRGNSMSKYPGTITWQDLTMTFNSFEGASTKEAVLAWRALCYNVKKDLIPSLANAEIPYKQTCYLLEYSGDWRLQRTWKIINAFPADVKFSGYSGESTDTKQTITLTLRYDRAEISD